LVSTFAFLYAIFILVKTFIFGIDMPGYASMMVTILFLSGLQFISLGILGEYMGRIFTETKQRPIYIIREFFE
jgi:polyisoprenyl-phosphate glycosyltransferase